MTDEKVIKGKYSCPNCGSELSLTQTKDFGVDVDTGEVYLPTVDNFLSCLECDEELPSDLQHEIINISLAKDLI